MWIKRRQPSPLPDGCLTVTRSAPHTTAPVGSDVRALRVRRCTGAVSAPHAGEHGTRRGRVGIWDAGLPRDVPQRTDGVLQHGQPSVCRGDVDKVGRYHVLVRERGQGFEAAGCGPSAEPLGQPSIRAPRRSVHGPDREFGKRGGLRFCGAFACCSPHRRSLQNDEDGLRAPVHGSRRFSLAATERAGGVRRGGAGPPSLAPRAQRAKRA